MSVSSTPRHMTGWSRSAAWLPARCGVFPLGWLNRCGEQPRHPRGVQMRSHGVNWTDRLLGDAFTIEHAVEPRSDPPPITRTSPMSSCAPGVAEARPGLVFAHSDVRLNGLLHYGFCASACRRAPQIECLFVSRG